METRSKARQKQDPIGVFLQEPGFLPELPFSRELAIGLLNNARIANPSHGILSEEALGNMNDTDLEAYLNITLP